jgi:hypothetical protein
VGGANSHVVFGQKFPGEKKKCKALCCSDVTTSSFVDKVRVKVFTQFQAVAVKCHSSMRMDSL